MTNALDVPPEDLWKQTHLWEAITASGDPEAEVVRSFLNLEMPKIERVLRSGGTSSKDFTLHDDEHSWRVAQKMAQVIPAQVLAALNVYEMALLLLSAYLHDIGMTPEYGVLKAHYDYLAYASTRLSPEEREEIQHFLDSEADLQSLEPPLLTLYPGAERQAFVEQLVARYAREKHNDWSQRWIENHLPDASLGSYKGWRADLVMLCRSHHEGYAELMQTRFNPGLVGTPGRIVHFRYLAAVLRMADILDFDPERTPRIIFEHRAVIKSSAIYWWKDHEVATAISADQIRVSARPDSARVHRAVLQMLDDIDAELRLCRMLDDNTHFDSAPGAGHTLPHRWQLPVSVVRNVQPRDGKYIYIDGSFRPNTEKLLQLLAGSRLYGSPLAGVRELLQNAFDAVKEDLAVKRLHEGPGADPAMLDAFANLHMVTLSLTNKEGRLWLECTDTGVGMTRQIISDHLLVSGSPKRSQIIGLERACREAGFTLGRTGEFGIGALSYFMLADQVVIETRRNQTYQDEEGTGWSFETGGVGSFGELRASAAAKPGTAVRLRLRDDATLGVGSFWASLLEYLRDLLVNVPCRVRATTPLSSLSLSLSPGWARQQEALKEFIAIQRPSFNGLFPETDPAVRAWREQEAEVTRLLHARLRLASEEGQLPGGMGAYRVVMPYFEYPFGISAHLVEMPLDTEAPAYALRSNQIWRLSTSVRVAWNGIEVPNALEQLGPSWHLMRPVLPFIADVDLRSSQAASVAIDRRSLEIHPDTVKQVQEVLTQTVISLVEKLRQAPDAFVLDDAVTDARLELGRRSGKPTFWIQPALSGTKTQYRLTRVRYPATDNAGGLITDGQLYWRGQQLQVLGQFSDAGVTGSELKWNSAAGPFDTLGVMSDGRTGCMGIWTGTQPREINVFGNVLIELPPAWRHVYFINGHDRTEYRNRDHVIVRVMDPAFAAMLQAMEDSEAVLEQRVKDEALQSRGKAAAWLAAVARDMDDLFESGIIEAALPFIELVLKGEPEFERLGHRLFAVSLTEDFRALSVGAEGVDVHVTAAQIARILPEPGPEWIIQCGEPDAQ